MDEILNRQLPHDDAAEQAVIGSMLIDDLCISDVVEKVSSADFYSTQNRDIYETIHYMFSYNMKVDPITVLDQMKSRGKYRNNMEQYMAELMRVTPTSANVMEYCAIVKDRALMRNLVQTAEKINELVYEGSGEAENMLESAEQMIYALRQGRNINGLIPISTISSEVYEEMSKMGDGEKKLPGLSTGFADIDRSTLGLNPGELVILAARPAMGKTSMALNVALNAAKTSGKTIAVFSLEMSREQIVNRFLSFEGMVDSKKLLTGDLNEQEWSRLGLAASTLSRTDIRIDDNPTLSVADMNAQCRRVDNLGLVVIDYLQLMQSSGSGHHYSGESRTQAVSDMSRMLKIMAKELNVPVVCLSQLSRANESRSDKRPQLSDLRESGSIEQDADVVIGLYREAYYNQDAENPNEAEAIILKNRKGETGSIRLSWLPEYTCFANLDTTHEEI